MNIHSLRFVKTDPTGFHPVCHMRRNAAGWEENADEQRVVARPYHVVQLGVHHELMI
jgi:hypothetical protein